MVEETRPTRQRHVILRLVGSGLYVWFLFIIALVYYDRSQFSGLFPEFVVAALLALAVVLLAFVWLRPKHAIISIPFFWIFVCIATTFITGAYGRHSLEARLDETIQTIRQGRQPAKLFPSSLDYEQLQQDVAGEYHILMRGGEFGCSDFVVGFAGGAKYYIEFCPQRDNNPSISISVWRY